MKIAKYLFVMLALLSTSLSLACRSGDNGKEDLGKGFYRDQAGKTFKKSVALCRSGEVEIYIAVPDVDVETYEELGTWYARDAKQVYYTWHNTSGGGMAVVEGADPKSFTQIAYRLGKDKRFLYKTTRATNVDIKTMVYIDRPSDENDKGGQWGNYIQDKNAVYYGESFSDLEKLEGADPGSFRCTNQDLRIGDCHPIDNARCYFRGKIKPDCDSRSLVYVGKSFTKDKKRVFYGDKVFKADVKSFRCVGSELGKKLDQNICHLVDKDHYYAAYRLGKIVEGADPDSLVALNWAYAKDSNNAYYRGKKVEHVDVESFEVINYEYGKDSKFVFRKHAIVDGADPSTFELPDK